MLARHTVLPEHTRSLPSGELRPAFSNKLHPCNVMASRHTVLPEHKKRRLLAAFIKCATFILARRLMYFRHLPAGRFVQGYVSMMYYLQHQHFHLQHYFHLQHFHLQVLLALRFHQYVVAQQHVNLQPYELNEHLVYYDQ